MMSITFCFKLTDRSLSTICLSGRDAYIEKFRLGVKYQKYMQIRNSGDDMIVVPAVHICMVFFSFAERLVA